MASKGRRGRGTAGTPGGERLRALREAAGRTQLWVELEAELGTGYLQRVESGKVAQPVRATRVVDLREDAGLERLHGVRAVRNDSARRGSHNATDSGQDENRGTPQHSS